MSHLVKILLFAVLLGEIYFAAASEVSRPVALDFSEIRAGDVAFRRGSSAASFAVLTNDPKSNYSHLGVVCLIGSRFMVVHATPDSRNDDLVKLEPIENFYSTKNASAGAIYRFEAPDSIASLVSEQALDYFENGTKFDGDFNFANDSAVYCTELVYSAFSKAGIELDLDFRSTKTFFFGEKSILYPSEFTNPKYFYPLSVKD